MLVRCLHMYPISTEYAVTRTLRQRGRENGLRGLRPRAPYEEASDLVKKFVEEVNWNDCQEDVLLAELDA
jgi:hypothetical protein